MSRVSKNIAFNVIGQGAIVALGFWGTRLVFRQLGDEALGILYFAIAIYAVLTPILDLGVSSTVVREVASHLKTDPEYVLRLICTSTLFYWCAYTVLAACVWVIAPWLVSQWIHLRTLDVSVAVHAFRVLALGLLLMLPRSLYSNLLRGVERMEFNNAIDVTTIALQQGGTILVIILGGGVVEIAYCYLISLVLSILAYIATAAQFFSFRAFLPGFYRDVVRKNLAFTSHVGAYSFLAMIQMEADKVLVSKLVPVGLLGFYGVAQTMVARVSRIPAAVSQAAFPRFSSLFHHHDRAGLLREYRRLQDLVCYGLVPVFAAIIFASKPLFTYLLSAQAARILLLPTILLCLGWYMNGTLNIPAILALAVGRADIGARQNLYALFLVLPVTVGLIWKGGLVGAGLSFVMYHFFAYSYGARRTASECLGMHPRDWYFHVGSILGLASATYGAIWLILNLSSQTSVSSLVVAYGLASAAYVYAAYLVVGDELREGFVSWRGRVAGGMLRYISSN